MMWFEEWEMSLPHAISRTLDILSPFPSVCWAFEISSQRQASAKCEADKAGPSVSLWEKAVAPHSSTLAWKIPWTEEPGRLQSMGSLRVGHDWATSLSLSTLMHWRRKWQPTPVFLPGESQGREPGGPPSMGSQIGHDWRDLAAAAVSPYSALKPQSSCHHQKKRLWKTHPNISMSNWVVWAFQGYLLFTSEPQKMGIWGNVFCGDWSSEQKVSY